MSLKEIGEIVFVGPLPPPLGGVAVTNRNIQLLVGRKYEISIFNTSGGAEREDLYSRKGFKEVSRLMTLIARYVAFLRKNRRLIYNVFVTSNIAFIRDGIFVILAKVFGNRVVVHLHSKKQGELFLGQFGIRFLAVVLNRADIVYVLSDDHLDYFSRYINRTRLDVLENFVFYDDFLPGYQRDTVNFLYVGRLSEMKGIYDILQAISALCSQGYDPKIHFAGAAESEQKERDILEYIENLGIGGCVQLHGLVAGDEKLALFRNCSVLVFPSHFENSPVVLKEAVAAQQTIICSDIAANINVLRGNVCQEAVLYYRCCDVDELVKKMAYVLDNKAKILALQREVRLPLHATDDFALNKLDRQFKELVSA